MSYILEALKQAEEERGSERLSKVLSAQPVEDASSSTVDWKKWLTIAIFVNAVVLFVWVAWKFVAITNDPEVNNDRVQIESPAFVDATPTAEKSTEVSSSISGVTANENSTEIHSTINATEKTVPAIAKPVASQVPTNVSAPEKLPSVPSIETAEPSVAPAVEEDISSSKIATLDAENLAPSTEELEQALVLETPASIPQATKPAKPVTTTPVIKAEINSPKVEPLPATPREQLAIDAAQDLEQPTPEAIEPEWIQPEVTEPEVVEQIAVVQRPPVPEFAELPYSLQQQIPEIRISVHIFNSEPQQRKVRINGQIFREGDEVARNLWVEEITPRGVIFDYDQTEFRLNLH